ncbi:MAG: diguanylate cyclase [Betaproteobacteria bacterium]|nr:diguanylate cyclase [Betaproteobacteria bacterium]
MTEQHTNQMVDLVEPLLVGSLVVGDLATVQQSLRNMVSEGSLSSVIIADPSTNAPILFARSRLKTGDTQTVPTWFGFLAGEPPKPVKRRLAAGGVAYADLIANPSYQRLLSTLWNSTQNMILLAAGMLLTQLALLTWILARGMKPLSNLVLVMRQIGEGDLGAKVPNTRLNEIAQVGDAFNHMVGNVKELMRSLRESEEQHRSALTALIEGVIIVRSDGIIQTYNPAARCMLGLESGQLAGALLRDHCHSEVREDGTPLPVDQHPVWVTLHTGKPVTNFVMGILPTGAAANSTRWLAINSQPLFSEGGAQPHAVVMSISDITERKEIDDRLRLAAAVFHNSHERIIITDASSRIVAVNDAFTEITGFSQTDAIGKNPSFIRSGRHETAFYKTMWDCIHQNGYWRGEIWNRNKFGEIFPEWISISAVKNEREVVTHYISIATNISVIKQAEDRLRHLAHYDALTDLPNRLLLQLRLDHAVERARRQHHRVAVLYMDLDRFKQVNDKYGHEAGDDLLRIISSRFLGRLREEDTLARLGGDEFVVLLEGINQVDNIYNLVNDLIRLAGESVALGDGREASVGVTIGVSLFPDDGKTAEELLSTADTALYKAKNAGRNTYRTFRESQGNADAPAIIPVPMTEKDRHT